MKWRALLALALAACGSRPAPRPADAAPPAIAAAPPPAPPPAPAPTPVVNATCAIGGIVVPRDEARRPEARAVGALIDGCPEQIVHAVALAAGATPERGYVHLDRPGTKQARAGGKDVCVYQAIIPCR